MIDWQYKGVMPPTNISLLVRMELVGPTYDVAVFVGVQADGEKRWIMADVRLNYRLITHWGLINDLPNDETGSVG